MKNEENLKKKEDVKWKVRIGLSSDVKLYSRTRLTALSPQGVVIEVPGFSHTGGGQGGHQGSALAI